MKALLKKYIVYLLSIAIVSLTMTRPAIGAGEFDYGKGTAGEAATSRSKIPVKSASPFKALEHGYAYGDTTEYDFPEDEENKHVWRDVALWVIVAGFVAFFVIKVFLEGDTDETEEEEGGKEIPPTSLIVPQPIHRLAGVT